MKLKLTIIICCLLVVVIPVGAVIVEYQNTLTAQDGTWWTEAGPMLDVRSYPGTFFGSGGTGISAPRITGYSTPNQYNLTRGASCIPTSSLPDNAVIDSAYIGFWGIVSSGAGNVSDAGKGLFVISDFYPANRGAPASADFARFGTSKLSSSISNATWYTGRYNNVTVSNTTFINKTGETCFGTMIGDFDQDGDTTNLTYGSGKSTRFAWYDYGSGASTAEILHVEYHLPPPVSFEKDVNYFNAGTGRTRTITFSSTSDPSVTSCTWKATNLTTTGPNTSQFTFNTSGCSYIQQSFGIGNWSVVMTGSDGSASNTTPPQIIKGLSMAGFVFNNQADHLYNIDISQLPLDPRSSTWANEPTNKGQHLYSQRDQYVTLVDSAQSGQNMVAITVSGQDNVPVPIPDGMNQMNGTSYGGDWGFYLLNVENGTYWEGYKIRAAVTGGNPYEVGWSTNTLLKNTQNNYTLRANVTGTGLAGYPYFPLFITYDELRSGHIDHAMECTVGYSNNTKQWPSRAIGVSANPNYPPIGTRMRLNGSFNIAGYSTDEQTVLTALKKYGCFVGDQGSTTQLPHVSVHMEHVINTMNYNSFGGIDMPQFDFINETTLMQGYFTLQSNSPPIAAFSATPLIGASPLSVTFTDASSPEATSWSWAFKNATVGWTQFSTDQNPVQAFPTGTYDINLTATNAFGSDDEIKQAYIAANPTGPLANFTQDITAGTIPFTVVFTNTSENLDGTETYAWDFGDGDNTNATQPNPVHTYISAGTYTVALTVTNAGGTSAQTKTDLVTAAPDIVTPVAAFTKDIGTIIIPQFVTVTDTSTNIPTSWSWQWGDGTENGTASIESHQYSVVGDYTINLEVCNAAGCGQTSQFVRVVYPPSGSTNASRYNSWQSLREQPLLVFLNIWSIITGIVSVVVIGLALYFLKWMYDPNIVKGIGAGMTLLKSMVEGVIILAVLFMVIMYIGGTMAGL